MDKPVSWSEPGSFFHLLTLMLKRKKIYHFISDEYPYLKKKHFKYFHYLLHKQADT